eukprot:tig00021073_g18044.t1
MMLPEPPEPPPVVPPAGALREEDVVVKLDNIQKTYLLGIEGVPALRGVSLEIRRGEFVAVYGTSGGGKTSLLNIIGTIDKPTKGKLWIGGLPITDRTSDAELAEIRLRKIGFVFQTFNLLSSMTALENVEMPMVLAGKLSAAQRRARAKELLERMGLSHRLNHFPNQLSGGEQQRVTIARAVANRPDVLLLDEPTGDLDTKNTRIVMQLLTELNVRERITCIMVTHDVALKNYATKVVQMRDGKVQQIRPVPAHIRAAVLSETADLVHSALQGGAGPAAGAGRPMVLADCRATEMRQPQDYAAIAFQMGLAGPSAATAAAAAPAAAAAAAGPGAAVQWDHSLAGDLARVALSPPASLLGDAQNLAFPPSQRPKAAPSEANQDTTSFSGPAPPSPGSALSSESLNTYTVRQTVTLTGPWGEERSFFVQSQPGSGSVSEAARTPPSSAPHPAPPPRPPSAGVPAPANPSGSDRPPSSSRSPPPVDPLAPAAGGSPRGSPPPSGPLADLPDVGRPPSASASRSSAPLSSQP